MSTPMLGRIVLKHSVSLCCQDHNLLLGRFGFRAENTPLLASRALKVDRSKNGMPGDPIPILATPLPSSFIWSPVQEPASQLKPHMGQTLGWLAYSKSGCQLISDLRWRFTEVGSTNMCWACVGGCSVGKKRAPASEYAVMQELHSSQELLCHSMAHCLIMIQCSWSGPMREHVCCAFQHATLGCFGFLLLSMRWITHFSQRSKAQIL